MRIVVFDINFQQKYWMIKKQNLMTAHQVKKKRNLALINCRSEWIS